MLSVTKKYGYPYLQPLDFLGGVCYAYSMIKETNKMTETEWNELYRKVYDAYDYAALKNEGIREILGMVLDTMNDKKSEIVN